jgi:putative phage-type endonuclease
MSTLKQRSEAWHEARKRILTASDFGAALGIDPYRSRQALWRIKLGLELVAENDDMRRGNALEPIARHAYEVATGHLVDETGLVLHPAEPWLGASPDGYVGDDGLVEIKCPRAFRDLPPQAHLAQIQGQLEVTGRAWCDYAQFVDGTLRVGPRVMRDAAWWADALPRLREFWRYVEMMEQPPRMVRRKLGLETPP